MIAQIINAVAIIIGGLIGTLSGSKINTKSAQSIMTVMGLITACIGIQGAASTKSFLVVVLSMVIGTVVGMLLRLDDRINSAGDYAKKKLENTPLGKGKFSEGFVTCSILFGVGTMAILGSIRAGLDHDYSIILTKSCMDFISAVAFSSALGSGVIFAFIPVFIAQSAITLLASAAEPVLTAAVINEMSAVGGPIFLAMSANLLNLREEKFKVGDMLPAIFLPIFLCPAAAYFGFL